MIWKSFLALTALTLAGTGAIAAGDGAVLSKDGSIAIATRPVSTYSPPGETPSGLVTIYSNLGKKYPKAPYFSNGGFAIYGPNNAAGYHELWDAVAFTSNGNHTITRIQFAANIMSGTNEIVVALYSDAGGLPGTALKTWRVSNLSPFPSCCTIEAKGTTGIPVTDGTQYWLVFKTDDTNKDSGVIWNYNTTDMVDYIPFAQYCSADVGGASCGAYNDIWRAAGSLSPQLAFAILGSD